jgi:outer membrane protein assembly complex protein YaeT
VTSLATCYLLLVTCSAQSPTVVEVRAELEGRPITDPALLDLIENEVGQPLSMQEVNDSIAHLMSLNRFNSVEVPQEPVPGGIRLIYRLIPLHPVDRLEFRGNLGVSEGTLRQAVNARFGPTPQASRAEELEELLRQVHRDRGYPKATVTHAIVDRNDPDRATLVVTVDAGPRVLITDVVWKAYDELEQGTLVGLPDIRKGQPYDIEEIRRTLDRYVSRMRENGFYEAFAEPMAEFQADGAVVTIALRRGPRVRVEFTGDALSRSEQERLVPVREEASVVEDLQENWQFAILNHLRDLGHRDADVDRTSRTDAGVLIITFHITKGPRYEISSIRITGHMAIPELSLREALGAKEGQPFVESALDAGAFAMEQLYLAGGFTGARVTPQYTPIPSERPTDPTRGMQVVVNVSEGPKTTIASVAFSGNKVFSEPELRNFITVTEGVPYSQREMVRSREGIEQQYRDRGYESVAVTSPVSMTDGQTSANILFSITEGPQILVDRIIIDGNRRTSRETIEREMRVHAGDPMGETALAESRLGLSALGLFRRVRLEQRRHVGENRRDLVVRLEELPPTTLGWGGGVEVSSRLRPTGPGGAPEDRLEVVPRGFFEIGRRNMWGKNRSVNLFTRVSLRSQDTVTEPGLVDSDYGINEYRIYGTFREPRLFGSPYEVLVTGISERAIRTSYSFETIEGRVQMGGRVSAIHTGVVGFSIENTEVFDIDPNLPEDQKPLIDRVFPQVRLSKFWGSLIRNTRDDDLDPTRGTFISTDGEVAGRAIGSEVGYVKGFVQASWYKQLPAARRIIFAVRGALGAAHGFARTITAIGPDGTPLLDPDGNEITQTDQDLPASERFFAGGANTHRGFSTDRLGAEDTMTPSGFPTGGNAEILVNTELRVGIYKALAGAIFMDVGNVFKRASDMRLDDLRPGAGFGLHYRSFVGPIRAEMGFNLDRRVVGAAGLEKGNVLFISLGPAF